MSKPTVKHHVSRSALMPLIMPAEVNRAMKEWNNMTKQQRAAALSAADTASPAVAMRHFGFEV